MVSTCRTLCISTLLQIDHILGTVTAHDPGTLMAKCELEAAIHNITVILITPVWYEMARSIIRCLCHPFWPLLCPFNFNLVAGMVEWIFLNSHNVSALLHYLHDLITAGSPASPQCTQDLQIAKIVCPEQFDSSWLEDRYFFSAHGLADEQILQL